MDCLLVDENIIADLRTVEKETGEPLVSVLADMFMKDTPRILGEMQQHLEKEDLVALGKLAHGLKSTSGNLGMVGFMQACGHLDAGIKQNKISKIEAQIIFKQLEQSYPLLADRLNRLKNLAVAA